MKIKLIIKISLILICIFFYCYFAIKTDNGNSYNVSIDTAKPINIEWPVEIAIVGDEGEKGFRIGPNIGRGWLEEAGGKASYSFYVPKDDKYYIWVYCLWFDECSNAVFAKIDDMEKVILGNDPVYDQWHWRRGFDVRLGKGTHTIVLSNHSDHISLQTLYLTNSVTSTPDNTATVFSDIFYDGFDGCDQGNYSEKISEKTVWKKFSGEWIVGTSPHATSSTENILIGESKTDSIIFYENQEWTDYSLNITMQPIPDSSLSSAGICFGVKDPNSYHELTFNYSENSDTCNMQICKKQNGVLEILSEFPVPWNLNQWHQLEISLSETNITVQIDDITPFVIPKDYKITGGIGIHLNGEIKSYFDDIHVINTIEKTLSK